IDPATNKRFGELLGAHYVIAMLLLLPYTLLLARRSREAPPI
ncbi:MAG: hypothetical protein QOF78_3854, partial [Phycisphaerales bacterium]|nr:hypothetical protein [Phycisphaerales bacterium]